MKTLGAPDSELRIVFGPLSPVGRLRAGFQSTDPSVIALMVATVPPTTAPAAAPATPNRAVRLLGRYQLMRLLGKSAQTMLWLAVDTRGDVDVMLAMPRARPADPDALGAWIARVTRSGRLKHPKLARVYWISISRRFPLANGR